MTLEQLRIFIAVAESEHVTRAAEALRLTQSAVSAAISALERRYGVALFDRVGRRIELNAEGRLFLDEARAVLARATAAELALSELSGLKRGTLSVHASQTIASYWLPPRLVAFRRAYPQIEVKLSVGNTAQTAKAVIDGTAELGFVEGHVDDPALEQSIMDRDRLVIVVAPDHAWARKKRLTDKDIVESEWVLREPGSGTRSEFESALAGKGLSPDALKVVLELPSNEAVRAAVQAGCGATAISELVVEASLRAGMLVAVDYELPARSYLVARHRERYRSKAAQEFLKIVSKLAEPRAVALAKR
ncbi:MAG TPA: LysR substrate-binding domain-containing protein [Pseudolabrys sp.]|nr:LysR substrate-binding domain-containing protein [Pseudolabrys sp.]